MLPSEKLKEKKDKELRKAQDKKKQDRLTNAMRRAFSTDDGKEVLKYLHIKYGVYKSPLTPNQLGEMSLASTCYFQGMQDVYKDIRSRLTRDILIDVEFHE